VDNATAAYSCRPPKQIAAFPRPPRIFMISGGAHRPQLFCLVPVFINKPMYSRDTASCGRGSVCGFAPSRDQREQYGRKALPNF